MTAETEPFLPNRRRRSPQHAAEKAVHVTLVAKSRVHRDTGQIAIGLTQQPRGAFDAQPCGGLLDRLPGAVAVRRADPGPADADVAREFADVARRIDTQRRIHVRDPGGNAKVVSGRQQSIQGKP